MKNLFITCKESRVENQRSFYGSFSIGPFNAEQSGTIANALRRTLLSECPGIGIISVTIDNVSHEYSSLPGMKESVLDLILNLKEIVLKKKTFTLYKKKTTIDVRHSFNFDKAVVRSAKVVKANKEAKEVKEKVGNSFFKPVTGFLKVKGPAVIRAKDLKLPPLIECVDPEQYIATLAEDGYLSLKFIIMEGKGYIIQQNDSFIDENLVKNRIDLINQFKNSNASPFPTASQNKEFDNKHSLSTDLIENKRVDSPIERNQSKDFNSFLAEKENPLNLDTIFNPVTKISYIIEDFDNKFSSDSGYKLDFIDNISSLLESNDYLKQNLPLLNNEISLNSENFTKFLETYSPDEIKKFTNSLHPLKKQSSLHSIVLEIWTNGSLHPREALDIGFESLATTFLNLQKTQKSSSLFLNETAFQKSLTLLENSNNFSTSYINIQSNVNDFETETSITFEPKKGSKLDKQNKTENLEDINLITKSKASVYNLEYLKTNNLTTYKTIGIEVLKLQLRPYTLLKRSNIHTLSDLCNLTINKLKNILNKETNIESPLGKKYIKTIITNLKQKGLSLKE